MYLLLVFGLVSLEYFTVIYSKRTTTAKTDIVLFSECIEDIGCIEVTEDWYHPTYRPVNLKPLERHTIKTEFLILGSDDNDVLVFEKSSANPNSISNAGYQKGVNVIIAIHDFTSDGYTGWIKHLGLVLLKKYASNVISVDWQSGAEPPFDQAAANARVVALEIIAYIKVLLTLETDKDDIHLVGHGLGAHIAGYVGQEIKDLKKITGLDPTGPRFQNMPKVVRLDSGDAKYVEVLHTDYFEDDSQGTDQLMGDANFFLNNAELQPGCKETKHHSLLKVGRDELLPGQILPGCSHKRAFKYFIESIEIRECIFVGIKCENYEKFLKGKCTSCMSETHEDLCVTFGLLSKHNITTNSTFYLNTAEESPYCLYTYAISIILDADTSASFTGHFEILLLDENNILANLSFADQKKKYREYKAEDSSTYLYFASHPRLGALKQAKVKWTKNRPAVMEKLKFRKHGIKIKKLKIVPVTKGPVSATLFKPAGDTEFAELPSGEYKTFNAYEIVPETLPEKSDTQTTMTTTTTSGTQSTEASTSKTTKKTKAESKAKGSSRKKRRKTRDY